MAHVQQQEYCLSVKRRFPEYFSQKFVLDVGSLDVNGNNQDLFDDCLYLGLDIAAGRNVDIITTGHELGLPDATFDVIVSTECFEHDRYYDRTLRNIARLLKPGGLFLFSCATTGRAEHGTLRTTAGDAPLLAQFGEWANYYKNLEESDIRAVLDIDRLFSQYQFGINYENHDLYFWGIKAGVLASRADYSFQIKQRWLQVALKDRDVVIRGLQDTITARDHAIVQLHQQVTERDKAVGERELLIGDRDRLISERDRLISERNVEIGKVRAELAHVSEQLKDTLNSTSWRITAGLRRIARWFR